MSNFFVEEEIYEKRIAICKECIYYSKILGNCKICGCFMKIKARISNQHCPKYYWTMHDFGMDGKNLSKDPPADLIDEVMELWPDIKTGRAKNHECKRRMIELYNVIYNADYDIRTSCRSCVDTCFKGITSFYEKYKGYVEEL